MAKRNIWVLGTAAMLFTVTAAAAVEQSSEKNALLARADNLVKESADRQRAGSYAESERLLREAIAIRERCLGYEDLLVATALNDLGVALFYQAKLPEAEAVYRRALSILDKANAPVADEVAAAGNLAALFREQRRLGEAENEYAQIFELIGRNPAAVNELALATVLHDYGLLQKVKGNADAAQHALERSAEIRERRLPAGHAQIIAVWVALADAHYARREFGAAEELFRKASEMCEQKLGRMDRGCAPAYNGLALTLGIRGLPDEAERLFVRALAIFEQTYGAEHPRVAAVLNNLGTLADRQHDFKNAEKYLKRALDVWTAAYGPGHPDVASASANLASAYLRKRKFDKAESLFRRALEIDEKTYGKYHEKLATDLNNLAALYNETKRYAEAEECFDRAVAIFDKLPKSFELSLAGLLANYGAEQMNRKKYAHAAELYRRAVDIYERNPEDQTPHTALIFDNYANLMRQLEEPAEAQKAETAAMRIRVRNAITNQRLTSGFAR